MAIQNMTLSGAEHDFYSTISDMNANTPLSEMKARVFSSAGFGGVGKPLTQMEREFLQNFASSSKTKEGDLWIEVVASLGLTPTTNLTENKRLFYTSAEAQLQTTIRMLSPTVYYPLNETSGSTAFNKAPTTVGTLNGTVSNVTIGQPGNVGEAYSFDGVGDRVIVAGLVPSATFSFALAFKRNGAPDANDRILDQASGGPTKGWHISLDADGNVGLRTWNDSGAQLSLDFGIVADAEWCVLSGTIGASASKLYLNGIEVDTGGGNRFGAGVVADLQLGARSGGTTNPLSGFIQHVAIASGVEWTPTAHQKIANFFFNLNTSRVLEVNGAPLRIQGWNYSSNYLDGSSTNPWYIETNQIPFDAQDIKNAGIHVYKIYGTATNEAEHLAAMQAIKNVDPEAKFMVLDFVTYETDYSVATGGANRTAKINEFVDMVEIFMQESAVIGYGFGNENNINLGSTSVADWYSLVDAACAAGKAVDSTRFYYLVDADLGTYPGDAALPNLDVVGLNIYRGTTFTDLLQDILQATSKPVILTEFGVKRTNNTTQEQQDQANEVTALIEEVESYYPFISGWTHFKYTHTRITDTGDEFWEATAPLAEGVYQSRTKFELYNAILDYCTA